MKKLYLVLILLITMQNAIATDFAVDGINYTIISSNSVMVSHGSYEGSITIPSSVSYNYVNYTVASIDVDAFFPSSLTTISIPNTVKSIGENAFMGTSLTSIFIPSSVTYIGSHAFKYCFNLTSILVDSENVNFTSFNGALYNKEISTLLVFPEGLSNVSFPNTLKNIGEYAFEQCDKLTYINIPNTVTSISYGAFGNCNNLTNITIPKSVTSIGDCAFYACGSLKSINIPNTVTYIGNYAFIFCSGLKSIFVNLSTPIDLINSISVFYQVDFLKCTLYVPFGSKTIYQLANHWKDFKNIVEMDFLDGLSSPTNNSIKVFPSIVNDNFKLSGLNTSAKICIYNMEGKLVLTKQTTDDETIPVKELAKGSYIVKVSNAGNFSTHRIFKL